MPLTQWVQAAYLVSTLTPGISAVQLQRQLRLAAYETAWTRLHRLRRAMLRPEQDRISGTVEVDESDVGGPKHGQRGRGAANKVWGAGAAEVRGEGSGRVRLTVIPTASKEGLTRFVQANVVEGSTIVTDGLSGYEATGAMGYDHQPQIQGGPHNPRNILPRIHRAFSNLKTWLAGTHHGVGPKNLPVYLREFVFRFHRRKTPIAAFQALLGLTARHPPEPVQRRQRESDSIR